MKTRLQTGMTADQIFHKINANDIQHRDMRSYKFIILGKPGPTGKTWLYMRLKDAGFNAYEISEDLLQAMRWETDDTNNHYIVNNLDKTVVIVLNKRFDR